MLQCDVLLTLSVLTRSILAQTGMLSWFWSLVSSLRVWESCAIFLKFTKLPSTLSGNAVCSSMRSFKCTPLKVQRGKVKSRLNKGQQLVLPLKIPRLWQKNIFLSSEKNNINFNWNIKYWYFFKTVYFLVNQLTTFHVFVP